MVKKSVFFCVGLSVLTICDHVPQLGGSRSVIKRSNERVVPILTVGAQCEHYFSYTHATKRCIQEGASTMPNDSELKAVSSGKIKAAAFKAVSNE